MLLSSEVGRGRQGHLHTPVASLAANLGSDHARSCALHPGRDCLAEHLGVVTAQIAHLVALEETPMQLQS
jgi:hypothetical protein